MAASGSDHPEDKAVRIEFWLVDLTKKSYSDSFEAMHGKSSPKNMKRVYSTSGIFTNDHYFKHQILLDVGYYFDKTKFGLLHIIFWFKLSLCDLSKKDYVERPYHEGFRDASAPKRLFADYLNAAKKVVKIALDEYALEKTSGLPHERVKKLVTEISQDIMNEWVKLRSVQT